LRYRRADGVLLLYNIALSAAFVAAAPFYLWKGRRTGKYLRTFRERLGRLPPLNRGGERSIWVHAVSVGEVLAARGLVESLKRRLPGRRIFLSTTTVTGNAVASQNAVADGLFFAPFDWPGPVRRALEAVDPALLVLVETELWPNLIHEARRRGTRVALVNGRISPRSFPRYRRLRGLLRDVLAEVDLFLMQGEAHARRVREMGAPADRVRVLGNLKYDAPPARGGGPASAIVSEEGRPVWVAGSTARGEEELVLEAFGRARERVPALRLVLAPRHPERFDEAAALVTAAGLRCARRSRLGAEGWRDGDVLVLDTMGELAAAYGAATVVFVGGSLVPAGGHNVLEPAALARAIVVGPHMQNFQEIAEDFTSEGALVTVRSAEELAGAVVALVEDEPRRAEMGSRARAVLERHRGAVDATVSALIGLVA
jgi:3-deoxy-D-manno-octulosonic-acid transferase